MMRKTLLVLKTEIINTFTRRSFLFLTFGLPIVGFLLFTVVSNLNEKSKESIESIISAPAPSQEAEGYVDYSGVIQSLPSNIEEGRLIAYATEEEALQALAKEEVSAFYVIPEDVIDSGEIILVKTDFNPLSIDSEDRVIHWTFKVNLLGGDENLTSQINNPLNLSRVPLEPTIKRGDDSLLAYMIPYATTMLFYFVILGSASMLLNSVAKEKENQVIEVLLLSVSPRQLLSGKIIGLGITGLLQTLIYTGVMYSLLSLSGRNSITMANFDLPPSILGWGVVFFLLGYTIYASLMAGLGALVPNMREASQATFVVIMPLIIPMMFMTALIKEPQGTMSVVLSLFPLTAPVAMMTRMAASIVPVWQPLVAVGLMIITAVLILRMVSGLFRAQTLLSGQEFKIGLFFKALVGKA
jgi:ABC-2 type transport system permease protein